MPSPQVLMTLLFRLEADRTEAICGLGRVAGSDAALAATDARIEATMAALDATGVLYPLHMLARTSRLDDTDYVLLQMALLHRHGPDRVRRITAALDAPSDEFKLSHAVQIFGNLRDDWDNVRAQLLDQRVFAERVVLARWLDGADGDAVLEPGPAVAELMGWD